MYNFNLKYVFWLTASLDSALLEVNSVFIEHYFIKQLQTFVWEIYSCSFLRDGTIQTAFSWKLANNLTVFYTQVLFWNCISFFSFFLPVVPTIACSKIELLGQLLHPRQLANSLVCCIMGVIVAWCCAMTTGSRYDTLGSMCPQSDG